MSYDCFIKLAGVEGESKAAGYENSIEVFSFSFGASNPVSRTGAGGLGAGKVDISAVNFMKKTDKSTPKLFQACCDGQHFDKCSLTMRKAGGKQVEFFELALKKVYIESYQVSGSGGGDDTPSESISMAFESLEVNYWPQDAAGGKGGLIAAGWDITKVAKQ